MRHVELKTYDFHDAAHWRTGLLRRFEIDGDRGLASLRRGEDTPTYITPELTSPDGFLRGWSRAEIDVDLADAAELVVDAAWELGTGPESSPILGPEENGACWSRQQAFDMLEKAIPWDEASTRRYGAGAWPAGRPLQFPLYAIDSTRLRLRLRVHGGHGPSRIRALRVLYPNLSLARHLPAVYREDAESQPFLRGVMALFESVFGGLENDLAALPTNIDPETAPDAWLPLLLRWLGLPRAVELSAERQGELLKAAPSLLRRRGTRGALIDLLRILVGDDFDVVDHGAGPTPWILPRVKRPERGSRLGEDTLVLRPPPPEGPRLGADFELARVELGPIPSARADLFALRAGRVDVRVVAATADRPRLDALLHRYLDVFVPAHCRYDLSFVPRDELDPPDRFDDRARLYPAVPPRLGESARLGGLRISEDEGGETLGDGVRLDSGVTLLE